MPRLHRYVSKDMAWLVKWHSIQPDSEPLMDARDRALFEKYFKPFARHDRTYIFHHTCPRSVCRIIFRW